MSVGAAAANIAGIGASQSLEDAQIQAIEPGQKPGDQSRGQGQDGYRPVRVLQESLANGGVSAKYGAISPSYVIAFNPADLNANGDGLLAMPNVDLAGELINLGVAQRAYEAGLKVIEAEEEMSGSLLDALN
jgi:flagellar basal-body rod protein FlgC